MHRAIRYGITLGALLLGAGCENQAEAPTESSFIPRPKYVSVEQASPMLTTRVAGYALDPEAFFLSIASCQAPACPLPPFLLDNNPLFLRSVVRGAPITVADPLSSPAQVAPLASTDPLGIWTLRAVPSRKEPYFPIAPQRQGALPSPTEDLFPGLPPIPPTNYQRTVTLRPVKTVNADCFAIEAAVIGDSGITQAIAKFLTTKSGTPVTVADLLDPTKYGGVVIVWNYFPGFPYGRIPGDGTTVEASAGQVLSIEWAPPGVLPPPVAEALQSMRGFFVNEAAPVSSLGISAVLLPPTVSLTQEVTYTPRDPGKDAPTNAALRRPWVHRPLKAVPMPGYITFMPAQFEHADGPITPYTPLTNCISK
ncbi:hypothetical protein [Hyalangium gracile]|uniref:hypothetical protein n=1 Tax=Hyalangium gracile TaxID=394092 RepID=UPI001CCEB4D0|nr:hypothetical protein [Hyalangium gracile]